jgi:hypothetical protein
VLPLLTRARVGSWFGVLFLWLGLLFLLTWA